MRFDEDVVGVDIDPTMINTLNLTYNELVNTLLKVLTDVEKADKERALYLTHKPVKELSAYPEPFTGKVIENVFKFKQKMIKAMEGNQIAKKDKIEVLRKHLKGFPKESIIYDVKVKNIGQAFDILIKAFGNPSTT